MSYVSFTRLMPQNALCGFADELCKLAGGDTAAAAGTGIKPPPSIKLPRAPRALDAISAPKFGAPPGLRKLRMQRIPMQMTKLPAGKPSMPRAWSSPAGG
jgi:hypothetical protein